jgi:SAM-dependent methyltransferase
MDQLPFYASHAELYDLAFSWDVESEVEWLVSRFPPGARSVLEPFCGNGRLFPGLARRGFETAGVDLSGEMLSRASDRLAAAGMPPAFLARADVCDFRLGRRFDAAFCPVNSFGHLHTEEALVRHLVCVAAHLNAGGRYLVQLGLRSVSPLVPLGVSEASLWDTATPRGVLRTTWTSESFDPATRVETQVSRFEWLDGPHAGVSAAHPHAMRVWDWDAWSRALARTPFREAAAWDGDRPGIPPLPVGPALEGRLLAWHELTL